MEKKTSNHIRAIIILAIAIGGMVFAMPLFYRHTKEPAIDIVEKFDAANFVRALDEKEGKFAQCTGDMIGAIVPHHMIGGQFIADVFSRAKNVDRIIIIGPNHQEKGNSPIITSSSDWETGKGKVYIDQNFIDGMVSGKIATTQNDVIGNDHSIGNILPFVAYYLPGARVVPIILKRNISKDMLDTLVRYIVEQQESSNTLIVGSVDFSHYLTAEQSEKKDTVTIKAMLDKNYSAISAFQNDHVDSPPTVNVLLQVTDMLGSNKTFWRNANSFQILGDDMNNTTSYFELVFCKN